MPGVKRLGIGSSRARLADGAAARAAREMRGTGRCDFAADAMSFAELEGLFRTPPAR